MNLAGWDIVFAIDVDAVNAALATQRDKLVQAFDLIGPITARGTFGNWQIVPAGAGKLLNLKITIQSGTLTGSKGPLTLDGAAMTLQVALDLLPLPAGGGQNLGLDLSTISFISFDHLPDGMGEITSMALGEAFTRDLSQHASEVSFVLASISPVAAGAPAWLAPAALSFAYATPQGGSPVLAIFALTGPGDVGKLPLDVDPKIIAVAGVGMALAPGLFMKHVFAPALADALGCDVGSLALSGDTKLVNNGDIRLRSVSEAGENYYPKLVSFSAELIDDHINMVFRGNCDLGMDISMSFNGSSSVGLALGQPGSLAFSTIGSPSFDKDVDIPWYDHLLDIACGVAEIILQVTVAAISSELSDGISRVAGTSALVSSAPSIVGWVGSSGFTPSAAGLAGGFWIHGQAPLPPKADSVLLFLRDVPSSTAADEINEVLPEKDEGCR